MAKPVLLTIVLLLISGSTIGQRDYHDDIKVFDNTITNNIRSASKTPTTTVKPTTTTTSTTTTSSTTTSTTTTTPTTTTSTTTTSPTTTTTPTTTTSTTTTSPTTTTTPTTTTSMTTTSPTTTTTPTTTTSSTTTSPTTTPTPTTTTSSTTASPTTTTSTTSSTTTETTTGSTSTTSLASTTTKGSTTTVNPHEEHVYAVSEKGVTCMQFKGNVQFLVNYSAGNETKNVTISTDDQPLTAYTVKGNCGKNQSMTIQWNHMENISNITLVFSSNNKTWSLTSVNASLFMDPEIFKGADKANSTIVIVASYNLQPSAVAVNKSFSCKSNFTASSVNGSISGNQYKQPLQSQMRGAVIQIQAYNKIPDSAIKDGHFVEAIECNTPHHVSSIVPIVVGCVLGGMVVIVLIAYIVGRRRSSAQVSPIPSNESNA